MRNYYKKESGFLKALLIFLILGIVLANCGYQGPLYLPKKKVASGAKAASGTAKTTSSAVAIESSTLNKK